MTDELGSFLLKLEKPKNFYSVVVVAKRLNRLLNEVLRFVAVVAVLVLQGMLDHKKLEFDSSQ